MTPRDPSDRYAPPMRADENAPPTLAARALAVAAAQRARTVDPQQPDRGEVFAEIPRRDGSVLVVARRVYEGHPFVSIAPWRDGWPVKGKGVSVRLTELGAVLSALVDLAERENARTP